MKKTLLLPDAPSKTPKYQQLINSVVQAVELGTMKTGDRLPSINEASEEYYLSRDTVERAYAELYRLGVITSVNRRGYFITGNAGRTVTKVLLLVGSITEYNKAIYTSFVNTYGKNVHVDIYTFNYKESQFCETLSSHLGDYHYYVLMPHLIESSEEVIKCLRKVSSERIIFLDQILCEQIGNHCSAIVYDAYKEMYRLMAECKQAMSRYQSINLVLSGEEYFPSEMISGFIDYCEDNTLSYQILDGMQGESIEENTAYLTVDDVDLIEIIKQTEQHHYTLGQQIGVVSLHDSCFKSVLAGGITVMTNNPENIGKHLTDIIKNGKQQIDVQMLMLWRKSL
jgi:DNA-binding transcriptional regulator YhcF (GntR family)